MDGVCASAHISDECLPVIVQVRPVPALAQFVAQGHGHDIVVALGPICDVGESAQPIRRVEIQVVEPRVAIYVAATPLRLTDVHVWVDEDSLRAGNFRDVRPNLETGRRAGPGWVLFYDCICDFRAVLVAESHYHGDFERHVFAASIVDLVDHFDRITHADKIEANTGDIA